MKINLLAWSLDISTFCINAETCLSWLIILIDIFAIFYLVFVSFYRMTNFVRMVGWMLLGILTAADVIIVAWHPCILTMIGVLFTIMIMTAILSVVLPIYEAPYHSQEMEESKRKQKCGSYVIKEINENEYCFELYDKQDKFLVRSYETFKNIEKTKESIKFTRENGESAGIEDRTAHWIKEVNHPKFEILKENGFYLFRFSLDNKTIVYESKTFGSLKRCKKQLCKAVEATKSLDIYISVEKLSSSQAKKDKSDKSKPAEIEMTDKDEQKTLPPQEKKIKMKEANDLNLDKRTKQKENEEKEIVKKSQSKNSEIKDEKSSKENKGGKQ